MSQRHDRTTFGRWRLIHVCQNGGRGRDIMQLLWARFGCKLLTRFLDAHSFIPFKVSGKENTFGTCTFSTRTIRYPLALVLHFHRPHFRLVTITMHYALSCGVWCKKSHALRHGVLSKSLFARIEQWASSPYKLVRSRFHQVLLHCSAWYTMLLYQIDGIQICTRYFRIYV